MGLNSDSAGKCGSDKLNPRTNIRNSRPRKDSGLRSLVLLLAFSLPLGGCSVQKFAVNKVGDSLASGGTTFESDDDPDLVGEALPFSLKLMESLLTETPKHSGLLLATSSGFTQYAYVYVQEPAEEAEDQDLAKADLLRARARRLYLRARDYGLRGLEVKHPGFGTELRRNANAAVREAGLKDVPLLYWTAASWGAAISVSKNDPEMIADQPIIEALIDRAFELEPDYDFGAIHNFLISYEAVRVTASGDFAPRSRKHFERVVESHVWPERLTLRGSGRNRFGEQAGP